MITPSSPLPYAPARRTPVRPVAVPARRNSFKELFEQNPAGQIEVRPRDPLGNWARPRLAPPRPPAASSPVSRAATAAPAATTPAASASFDIRVPGIDLSIYTPIANPVSLDPLKQAMAQLGLSPDEFQFDQLESYEVVPGHPELSYINKQILIRGPHGGKLFDFVWALRTPWVTAQELITYKIA